MRSVPPQGAGPKEVEKGVVGPTADHPAGFVAVEAGSTQEAAGLAVVALAAAVPAAAAGAFQRPALAAAKADGHGRSVLVRVPRRAGRPAACPFSR